MKFRKILALVALIATSGLGSVQAMEAEIVVSNQAVNDEDFGLVSQEHGLNLSGFRLAFPLQSRPSLSVFGGYGFSSNRSVDAADGAAVHTELTLHAFEIGTRWNWRISGWFQPYVALSGVARVGRYTASDNITGWSREDPDDPSGETALYTVEPYSDFGVAGGVNGRLGLSFRLPARDGRQATLRLRENRKRRSLEESKGYFMAEGGDAEALLVGRATCSSEEALRDEAQTGDVQDRRVNHSPQKTKARPFMHFLRKRDWGINVEAGYALSTPLFFREAGSLELGGIEAGISFMTTW